MATKRGSPAILVAISKRSSDYILILSTVSFHLRFDCGVCQLQIVVFTEDWRHSSGWSITEGAGGQQQWHPETAEDEQLPSCLSSRYNGRKDSCRCFSAKAERKQLCFMWLFWIVFKAKIFSSLAYICLSVKGFFYFLLSAFIQWLI